MKTKNLKKEEAVKVYELCDQIAVLQAANLKLNRDLQSCIAELKNSRSDVGFFFGALRQKCEIGLDLKIRGQD